MEMGKNGKKEAGKKAEHYYSKEQTSEYRPSKVTMRVRGNEIALYTAGGVFSPSRLDKGTELLIEKAELGKGWRVLDLGCGYGIAGIAARLSEPSTEVVFSDVNERAIKLTRLNLKILKLDDEKTTVRCGDKYEKLKGEKFDTILFNPPQTAGKKTCFQMIEEAKEHLNPGGSLQLVARHQKGGKELEKKMQETFGNVDQVAKKGGFRVYISRLSDRLSDGQKKR